MHRLDDEERQVVQRVLDANANRCAEGLRVVEEIARFARKEAELLRKLKEVRHAVRRGMDSFTGAPFRFRDSAGDVGRALSTESESSRISLAGVARANFLRAEEALRVIEEFGKLLDSERAKLFKALRFELYSLERTYFVGSAAAPAFPPAPFLYGILDRTLVERGSAGAVAGEMIAGGVDCIQYRAKDVPRAELRRDLAEIIPPALRAAVPVIVNDDPTLAAETGARGVHLGRDDPSPAEARAIAGNQAVVGVTIHSMAELSEVPLDVVDYIAVGSIYPSRTKTSITAVGTGLIKTVRERVDLPVVAIGGIDTSTVDEVLAAGADGVAAVSALLMGDVRKNCFTFKEIIARRGKGNEGGGPAR